MQFEYDEGIHRLQVMKIIRETNDAKTFVLDFLDGWNPGYKAGQFVTLVFYTKHGEKRRSYSISSAPALGEPLSITIKKVENGEFSRLLLSRAKEGDILYCSDISGLFLLPANIDSYNQYFFIAAGSGITPCFSLLRTILQTGKSSIVLIYSNKNEEDTIFYGLLKKLQDHYNQRLSIHFLFSNLYDIYRSRLSNWLMQQLLAEHLAPRPSEALFYLCGPFEYMRMVNITLLERISANNILKENFNTLPRLIVPRPPDTRPHLVTLHFNNKEYKFTTAYPLSILATAKLNRISLPYSCEAGRCGSCVATCDRGKIWMAYNEVLLDEEIANGKVLLCQAFPVDGDVNITA